ncbi:MAG: hypothetical protein H6510_13125 [Acidobacteria bacterium]|nr:hypothetical protein [Acidobacteriota bacterium]
MLALFFFLFAQDAKLEADVPSRTIRWTTASEQDNFGFDIYRGESEEGPFERITKTPISGAINSDEPHQYSYVDATIDPNKAYFYYVESIAMNGSRERFTPVIPVKPWVESQKDKK